MSDSLRAHEPRTVFFSFLAAVKFTVLVNEPSEEGCVSLPGWYFMPDLRSSNAIFSTVMIRLYILAGVVQDDDSSISLGLWMTMWSKLPPTVVTTVQDWGLGQVTPKYVSVAYWLLWFSYLGNSQWKRDTFLSVSLKAVLLRADSVSSIHFYHVIYKIQINKWENAKKKKITEIVVICT